MDSIKACYIAPLRLDDADSLYNLMTSNASQFKNFLPKTLAQNQTPEASREYIQNKISENQTKSTITHAVKVKETRKVAGLIILKNIDKTKSQGEFAYCIGEKFTGNGWATKAVQEMSRFASEELGLKKLQIIAHKTNIASCKVAKSNGFVWKKTLIDEFTSPTGEALDMELFELQV
ncbi:ribosomal-protein-alanine N-acetyltransferase [Ulvibacter sp. MAR_2010_11]|uniref:GNAT family N-acetyltransferase n=1 Tax=Ulvibacter sp. MAR_2010_11 TaxID=1250229 RepID=UPI000C2B802B|nr:GNAT family N-acetyltransferase [Ulvibacter sp. MAR_2010_11]PKA82856.1 ribosomal-protein-alanine N-acetyltransferase [Ulvibacter sp. MAR_2010_11]